MFVALCNAPNMSCLSANVDVMRVSAVWTLCVCFFVVFCSVSLPISILSADFQSGLCQCDCEIFVRFCPIARNGIAFLLLNELMSFEDIMNDIEQNDKEQWNLKHLKMRIKIIRKYLILILLYPLRPTVYHFTFINIYET